MNAAPESIMAGSGKLESVRTLELDEGSVIPTVVQDTIGFCLAICVLVCATPKEFNLRSG